MRKRGEEPLRGYAIALAVLFSLPAIFAANSASFSLTPLEQYESTTQQYDLSVNNFGSSDVLDEITATINSGTIVGAVSYGGWKSILTSNNSNSSNSTLRWFDGTVETNVLNALFQFLVTAGRVTEDTNAVITLETEDTAGFPQQYTFNWLIRNDATGPVLTIQQPTDGMLLLQGAAPIGLIAEAQDPETGVRNVIFSYRNCTNSSNATDEPRGQSSLSGTENSYTGTADLSVYRNENRVCYDYRAENNGDAMTTISGTIIIDGMPPTVALLSPEHDAVLNAQSLFRFLPVDNLAPELSCTLLIDTANAGSGSFQNGIVAELSAAESPEGLHSWQVRCTDTVGLPGTSSTRSFFLDRTLPTILVDQPQDAVLKEGTPITIITDDNYRLANTQITFNGNTTNSSNQTILSTTGQSEGAQEILITAFDAAGNSNSLTFRYFIDKSPPVLTVLNPADGGTEDVFADFIYTAVDVYDPIVACTLFIDGTARAARNSTNETQNLTLSIGPGTYTWDLQCTDDAENTASSGSRTLIVIDTSGPEVQITPVEVIVRGNSVPLDAIITDYSGVASATAAMVDPNGVSTSVPLSAIADLYTASIPTSIVNPLGTYILVVTATDPNGYATTREETFELTYGYNFALFLNPSSTTPGSTVELSGTLRSDDGALIDSYPITLSLPAGNTSTNTTNGTFMMTFPAPGDGIYPIGASTVAPNGITFSSMVTLTVSSPSSGGGGNGGGGGGGGGGGRTGFGSSNTIGRSTGTIDDGSSTGTTSDQGSSGGQEQASDADTGDAQSGGQEIAAFDSRINSHSGGQQVEAPNRFGLGQAIGFLNLDALKGHRFAWTLGALGLILAVLFILGMKGHFHTTVKTEEEDGWESYLERLAKNR